MSFPDQPAPLGPPTRGDERREIANFLHEYRLVPDAKLVEGINGDSEKIKQIAELKTLDRERLKIKRAQAEYLARKNAIEAGQSTEALGPYPEMEAGRRARLEGLATTWKATEKKTNVALNTDALRQLVRSVLRGWPMRLVSGSLFVDDGRADVEESPQRRESRKTFTGFSLGPPVRLIDEATNFLSLLHDYARVKFNPRQDADGVNYVSPSTLFSNFCTDRDVPLWLEVERYPHMPPLAGHYYAWRPQPDGYEPRGEMLAEFLGFFDNIVEPWHRAVFAASVVTPFWGGPYGKRPFFFFHADNQGSGKTTAAEKICNLVGGYASVNFSQRDQERLKERILSDEFAGTRCLLGDNVEGMLRSVLLAEIATASRISGKKLAVGEAWRPNSLCVYLTGNNPELARDISERTLFVRFASIAEAGKDIASRADWAERLNGFLSAHSKHVMADCLAILAQPVQEVDWSGVVSERNAEWSHSVLAAVLQNPYVRACVGDISPKMVLTSNQAFRDNVDEELGQAGRFMEALVERVCEWNGYELAGETRRGAYGDYVVSHHKCPLKPIPIFVSSQEHSEDESSKKQNLTSVWRSSIRGDVNPSYVGKQIGKHIAAKRITGLAAARSSTQRWYELDPLLVIRFLAERAGRDEQQLVVEWEQAKNAANNG